MAMTTLPPRGTQLHMLRAGSCLRKVLALLLAALGLVNCMTAACASLHPDAIPGAIRAAGSPVFVDTMRTIASVVPLLMVVAGTFCLPTGKL